MKSVKIRAAALANGKDAWYDMLYECGFVCPRRLYARNDTRRNAAKDLRVRAGQAARAEGNDCENETLDRICAVRRIGIFFDGL